MILNDFGLFDFVDICEWYEIFDFQIPIHYALFLSFLKNFETYFDLVDINTIYNSYSNKKFYFKVGFNKL